MATTIKYCASQHQFVRNEYRKTSDRHKLSDEELKEVLSYKNISKDFEYNNWFGSSYNVTATLDNVEINKYNEIVFTISLNKTIPEHYMPSPSQVLKGKGLLFPVSVSVYHN